MRNRIAVFFVLLLSLPGIAVAGIAPTGSNSPRTLPTLGQAEHPKQEMAKKPLRRALRQNAQKKAALSWGAQTGYAKKTELRNRWLRTHAEVLDKIFTFRPFLEGDEHVLLPAVDSGRRGFRLEDPLAADSTLVSYRIRETARIVSIPPTFRDYLILDPGTPKKVNPLLLPQNSREKEAWKKWTERGWKTGEKLSDRAFRIGMRRLVRAIEGRIRFYELVLAGQIDRPTWSTSPAATLRTGEILEIGDKVLRITRPARFTPSEYWKQLDVKEGVEK